MSTVRHCLSACLLTAIALSGCSGGSGTVPVATSIPAAPPVGGGGPSSFYYGADALKNAQYIGPATSATMSVDVSLKLRNPSGLMQYALAANTPNSAQYRRYLTPQQIGAMYGASDADLTAAAQYFKSFHLHVGTWPQHLSLFVSGTQTAMQQAFGTSFAIYKEGGETFIGPSGTPHFSKQLAVTGVLHLVTIHRAFRTVVPMTGGAVTASGYPPQPIRNVFDFTGAYNAGYNGSGVTVGIVGTGPMSSADVPAYGAMFNTSVANVTQRNVTDTGVAAPGIENPPDAGFQTPPPVTTQCNGFLPGCNPEDAEAQIDTEAVTSLAPGSNVLFYLGYDPSFCVDPATNTIVAGPCGAAQQPLLGIDLSDDEIQQAIADNSVDVLSLSFGGPEQGQAGFEFDPANPGTGIGPEEFAALAAEGIAVFVSSGDSGAEGCQRPVFTAAIDQACVSYPATDPNVTSVGGVNAPVDQFGNLTNQITGWGLEAGRGQGGSGGGVSAYFPQTLTPWQQHIPGVQGSNRNQPDVSLLGDPATGMAALLYANLGGPLVEGIGGTSVAAPEMASMWALVLQACKQSATCATASGAKPYRLGNAAPLLYALYAKNNSTVLPTYAQTFYDVVYGDNQQLPAHPGPTSPPLDPGYNAAKGYDLVTGLGVPFARSLIKSVTHQ